MLGVLTSKSTEVNVYTCFLGVEVKGDYRNENVMVFLA